MSKAYLLKVPKDGTMQVYSTQKKAHKAMRMAVEYYLWNYRLEDSTRVVVNEMSADIMQGDATCFHFCIESHELNNFETWKR